MADTRDTDVVLAPNEYIYVSDLNTGIIKPIVGPTKKTLDSTEQPVVYQGGKFIRCAAREAVQIFPVADERSYLVLENPASLSDKEHPIKGVDNPTPLLLMGQKKNIPGPVTFALWPGQVASVIAGHQLRSNQYLRCVVHNAKEAVENWDKAIIDTTKSIEEGKVSGKKNLVTGQVLIIKGTEVSYYIPPTGINVVPDKNTYVRDAVTLERLEYCILLDESGDKRYVKGPVVVFPEPTETFIEKNGERKFRAIELNDNMGIYIKVIADYEQDKDKYKTGDELFITGKEQKIYYPRTEHAIIKYDDQLRHYAVAIPKGEARYVLNKDTGEITTKSGPLMYLPDPRHEVIVRRVLTEKEVQLWFPGNVKAIEHNQQLRESLAGSPEEFKRQMPTARGSNLTKSFVMNESTYSNVSPADDMSRHTVYTPPRMITLDSKYDGAVNINVWPGYAVQVVSKNGAREIVLGPKSVILDYDQTLEVMELSTGKPKMDHSLLKTVYLRVKNNRISDIVDADTLDMVHVQARVNYRVNFEGDSDLWFSVENYIKFLTQNLRSIIRNEIQKHGIEEIAQKATIIIRDVVLGISENKERPGRVFPENGMKVYDVEVLNLEIGDDAIRCQLQEAQHRTVENTLKVALRRQEVKTLVEIEQCSRDIEDARAETDKKKSELQLQKFTKERVVNDYCKESAKIMAEKDSEIRDMVRARETKDIELKLSEMKSEQDVATTAFERKFAAITPELISAMEASGNKDLARVFAEHIPQAGGGIGMVLGQQLIENILGLVKGTSMEKALKSITKG